MSLTQTAIEFLRIGQLPESGAFRLARRVPEVAIAPLSVVAGVIVGGVVADMPLTDILICELVAGGGVALFCAVAGWLFDGLWAPAGSGPGTIPVSSARWLQRSRAKRREKRERNRIGTPSRFVRRNSPIWPPNA